MSSIEWGALKREEFDKNVETLLVREYTGDGLVAHATEGRGGDSGIDVDVRSIRTGQLIEIFQLKHFPEGFSGKFSNRRAQIKESFETAWEGHQPPKWTLVVPAKISVTERRSVSSLRRGRTVRIGFLGSRELDLILAKHPDLEAFFMRDHVVEALKAVHRDSAQLRRPGDLQAEMQRIQSTLDAQSIYWERRPSFDDEGRVVEIISALRPDAAEREPLSVTFNTAFGPNDSELKARYQDALDYGASEPVILPPHVLEDFEAHGPEWFASKPEAAELHLIGSEALLEPTPATVSLTRLSRSTLTLKGRITGAQGGRLGLSLDATLYGGVTMRWRFPHDRDQDGTVSLEVDPAGSTAREVRRAIRFLVELKEGAKLGLTIGGGKPSWVTLGDDSLLGKGDVALVQFVEDLCVLEDHFEVDLRFPDDGFTVTDMVWARVMHLLLTGKATPYPDMGSFTATLSGESDHALRLLISQGAPLAASTSPWSIELFGEELEIEEATIYAHLAKTDHSDAILRALDDGTAEGRRITFRPDANAPFLMFSRPHIKDPNAPLLATPWNIPDVKEQQGFDRLPNQIKGPPKHDS